MAKKLLALRRAKIAMAAASVVLAASVVMPSVIAVASTSDNLDPNKMYYSEYDSFDEVTAAGAELNLQLAAEGFVLLKNKDSALPLAKTERKVTVLGQAQTALATGGAGSGSQKRPGLTDNDVVSETPATIFDSLEGAGFAVNPRMRERYTQLKTDSINMGFGGTMPVDNAKYMKKVESAGAGAVDFAGNHYVADEMYSDFTGWDSSNSVYGDAAIVVISRAGGEGADLPTHNVTGHSDPNEHSLELNDSEKEMMAYAKSNFDKVVVIINSPSVMELGALQNDDKIDSVLWIGQPGWNGVMAVGGVLTGAINPSGRTVDFWMRDFTSDPTWYNFGDYSIANYALNGDYGEPPANAMDGNIILGEDPDGEALNDNNLPGLDYAEGIYMGYRYYETVAADMDAAEAGTGEAWYQANTVYPFGYGLSYTTFSKEIVSVETDLKDSNSDVTVKVSVTNTGRVPGKEVVQIYNTSPYTSGGIEKSVVDLVGFAKTDLLKAGESQVVEVAFSLKDMSAFDYNDANKNGFSGYELEAGEYVISLRNNSHDVIDSYDLSLATEHRWNGDDDESTPNNIYSQTGNEWEMSNTLAYNWTVSGKDHYMTRGSKPDATNIVDFAEGIVSGGTEKTDILKNVSWLLTDDNTFKDKTFFAAEYRWQQGNVYENDYGSYDKDFDNPLTYEGETNYKNLWSKTKEDMEGKTQGKGVKGAYGNYEIILADVMGLDYDDPMWDKLLDQLTYDELAAVAGFGNFGLKGLDTIDAPDVKDNDGPGQLKGDNGSGFAWVCEVVTASTWNTELCYEQGRLIGNENLWIESGSLNNGWYGPALNTHRSPFTGRNFEYYSQDGLQGGKIAAAVIRGATDMGMHVYAKHSFMNDQETGRFHLATFATEQAIRQIYARQFEIAVRDGNCNGMMSSFNFIGIDSSASYTTNVQLYSNEWGCEGLSVTDMWADPKKNGWWEYNLVRGCVVPLGDASSKDPIPGTWDAAKNTVMIGEGDEAFESPTQWYWVRETAHRALYITANTAAFQHGFNTTGSSATNGFAASDINVANYTPLSGKVIGTDLAAKLSACFGKVGYSITSVEGLPEGLVIAGDGSYSGTITADPGVYNVTLGIQGNGGLAYVKGNINVKVTVTMGTLIKLNNVSATLGQAYTGALSQTAVKLVEGENYVPNGSAVAANKDKYISGPVYSAIGLPAGLSVNETTGAITGTPTEAGEFEVVLSATFQKVHEFPGGRWPTYKAVDEVYSAVITFTVQGGYRVIVDWGFDGKTSSVTSATGGTIGLDYIAALTAPERTGYKLLGFSTTPGGEILTDWSATQATTLYAVWQLPDIFVQDGELWLNGENTGIKVEGTQGPAGQDGHDGTDGIDGTDGVDGIGIADAVINEDGELVLTYTNGETVNLGVIVGADGQDGQDGQDGVDGQDGQDAVSGGGCNGSIASSAIPAGVAVLFVLCVIALRRRGMADK